MHLIVLRRPVVYALGAVLVCLILTSCGLRQQNFSQFPGFDAWYANNPPSDVVPGANERRLLERYRPRLFVADDSGKPIRFYEDYIAHGNLIADGGATVVSPVSRDQLNKYKGEISAHFTHRPGVRETQAQAIARIDRETFPSTAVSDARELTFLTYHFVFAHSGVAAGIRGWQQTMIGLIANPADWHQLDHYTAVSIVLDSDSKKPIAAIIQQHNYMRTWLLASAPSTHTLVLPDDNRIAIVAARRSNELYTWRAGRQFRRALPSMKADTLDWLILGEKRPIVSADDITEPQTEVDYDLSMLPPSDAFFVFKGWLGARRRTPGRDGPPGADFNTIPMLKPRVAQLAAFYWGEGDREYIELFRASADPKSKRLSGIDAFYERLAQALQRLK